MAPRESTATDPVRPCLVRWSNEVGQCDDRQSLTTGWDRESETGIVAKYRTGQQNRAGRRRPVTSIGSNTKVVSGKARLATRPSDSHGPNGPSGATHGGNEDGKEMV